VVPPRGSPANNVIIKSDEKVNIKPTVVKNLDDLMRANQATPLTIKYQRSIRNEETIESITETPIRKLDDLFAAARNSSYTKPVSLQDYSTPVSIGVAPPPIAESVSTEETCGESHILYRRSRISRSHIGSNDSDWVLTTSSSEKEIDSARESADEIGSRTIQEMHSLMDQKQSSVQDLIRQHKAYQNLTSRSGSFETIPEQIELNTTNIYETESAIRRQRRKKTSEANRNEILRKVAEADERTRLDKTRMRNRLSEQQLRADHDLRMKVEAVKTQLESDRLSRQRSQQDALSRWSSEHVAHM